MPSDLEEGKGKERRKPEKTSKPMIVTYEKNLLRETWNTGNRKKRESKKENA